jgi:hypothetical protein
MEKTTLSIRVNHDTKVKLERLKKYNPEISWDVILEPIVNQIKLPKPQSHSTKLPPIIPVKVNLPP